MSQIKVITPPVLPTIIGKGELATYLGCHMTTVWRKHLTKELLKEWGFDYDNDIKHDNDLSVHLTQKVYEYFNIEPLAWYSIVTPHLVQRMAA